MARTKQTARCAFVMKVPRQQLKAMKCARKTGPITKSTRLRGRQRSVSSSDSESGDVNQVNNQQFSVRFDDQNKCQQECVSMKILNCSNCEAVFTSQNKKIAKTQYLKMLKDKNLPDQKKQKFLNNYDSVWICEFCLNHNSIPKEYNAPQTQNPCFLIQKAKKNKKNNKEQDDDQNKILIFCIDISGSMELKVAGLKSRLDTVKQAIIDEINRMKFQKQVLKVGIVAFGSIVTLIGDGKTFKQQNLSQSVYHDFDKIVKQCSKIKNFASPIQKSYQHLKTRIQDLDIFGSTALGPGLLASIEIASKGGVGSKVIICTDGQANVGIGGTFSFSQQKKQPFYEKAATYAKNKRVSVSILSLKGDNCNLKQLGKLSLATGGSVLKIDPSALGTQFSKIAKQQILGTQINKIFQIISHVPTQLSADKTTLTQQFGNFSKDTQLTFEFNVLTKQQASTKPSIDMDLYNQQKVPMQIQLSYVGRNGNKYLQVITDWRQLTQNQKQIYDGANFGLFAASVLQRASSKIKSSQFKQAQKLIKGYWSLVEEKFSKSQKAQDLKKFGDRIKKLQIVLNSKLRKSGKGGDLKKKQKKRSVSKSNNKSRDRSRQRSRNKKSKGTNKVSKSLSASEQQNMSSDEQQQILWKQMRARSRSRSNSPKQKVNRNKKIK